MRRLTSIAAVAVALSLACSRSGEESARSLAGHGKRPPAPFDWDHPARALDLGPDDVAAVLGSFEWSAAVDWTVSRQGEDAARVHALEHHQLRQAPTGEFALDAGIDPGLGAGSESGKEIVYTGGTTYARARYAPFRERPTDRGRDARRFRDESFASARSLARLLGGALALSPAGEVQVLGRAARRYTLSLGAAGAPAPAAASKLPPPQDDDTKRRRAFLEGLRPLTASGELVLDAQSGAPLRARIAATFGVASDPKGRASVELLAQVKAIGAQVAAIAPPKGALADERKPSGVAPALEAAGLKKQPEEKGDDRKGRAEPGEDD